MRIPILLILGLLVVYAVDGNIIYDRALTANLQDAWYDDEFIIAISNIKDNKRSSGSSMETLLAVKYRGVKTKLVLLLDRRSKRVILESLDDIGRRSASHVKVDSLAVNTPLKSLIILVHQAPPNPRVDVYVDCIYEGSIPFKRTFRDMAEDNLNVEVFKERKCRAKVYQSSTITDVLRKEQCPDPPKMKKPSKKFKTDMPKTQPVDSDEDDEQKSTDRPDDIESSDESDGTSDQDNSLPPSSNTKFPWDHKKPSNKKHHPNNRPKKADHSGHPKGKSKPDKYNPDSSDPYSNEMDDLDYPDGSQLSSITPQSSQFPKGHPSKKSGHTKRPGNHPRPNKSDSYDSNKPGQSDETDSLDYPYGPQPQYTSQSPVFRPTKRPKSGPGRSPYSGNSGQNAYPNQTDMPDSSEEASGKRIPRRGDIGIQNLDERVCQTDDQLVKTLNELINVTRKLGRELEQNRMETQYLRHLIENCSVSCRTPIGE